MPDKAERELWWAFLAGKPETEWNPPKQPKGKKMKGSSTTTIVTTEHDQGEHTSPVDAVEPQPAVESQALGDSHDTIGKARVPTLLLLKQIDQASCLAIRKASLILSFRDIRFIC